MPSNIRIIHAHEFIKATPVGQVDLEKAKELLLEIASAAGPSSGYEILLDGRKAETKLTVTDLWYMASELIISTSVSAEGRTLALIFESDNCASA